MVGHLVEPIGNVEFAELTVRDMDFALGTLAKRFSTRSVRLARMILIPAGYAYRCHRARSAVREQRKGQRRPKLNR